MYRITDKKDLSPMGDGKRAAKAIPSYIESRKSA